MALLYNNWKFNLLSNPIWQLFFEVVFPFSNLLGLQHTPVFDLIAKTQWKTTHFLTHFYVQASISAEPNRMKRMCLVHWLTNESLMGIIFAANNCTHTLFGFHTLNLNKRKAVSHTSPGLSLPMHSDSSHWVLWYSLICIFDANVVFVYGNEYL